jgi:L-aminopeptidase/D-esterase-like protein
VPLGCVGAGTGTMAGRIKGGLGSASETVDSGITVAALMAVNALGSVINEASGLAWEIDLEFNGEFGPLGKRAVRLPEKTMPQSLSNTTIGVIATDAILTKAQAQKVAQMAQDGLARAIRPAHTMYDGDTIFCLSTGRLDLPQADGFFVAKGAEALNEIGRAAADCTSRAIIRAIIEARSLGTMTALRDLVSR